MSATRAWCGTTIQRPGQGVLLVISSTEARVLPYESFVEGEGADALLNAAQEMKGYFIEPTEILVGQ